ncbi:heme exporter protein B [Panacagrimonas perspica]|uniref:Heme exporter protein B n=1 Tax=Panacagrimonas perspica TaxID=381431 RepID=A0A4S3K8A7_9GAMM|nr:heme exporter protein CcmB [Panacagrimonas perspica]TDU31993.1 heme exporter protein B [Panacagrimonas perspica]THD04470.1 heme exporter protein CcmB [Panacagrimonas perspica]
MSAFLVTVARELRIAARNKASLLMPPLFFAIVVTLFALGGKPGDPQLAAVAPSVLWVGALLAALLTLDRLFRGDLDDGWLEQVFIAPASPVGMVLGKFAAHWLLTGLPLLLLAAPLALQLGFPSGAPLGWLLLGLLMGTPLLSIVGGFAAALTVSLPRAGLLLPVLVLPLLAPVVIFGSGAARAAQAGLDASGPIYFLAFLLVLSLTLLPWAATAALRSAFD